MRKPVDMESVEAFLHSHERIEEPRLLKDGQVVGEWVVRAFLGRGGSGEVYRAEHRYVHIASAIKILFRDDAPTKNRFSREAQVISVIQNPAFPKFYSFGEVDNRPYLVIELLEHYPLPQNDVEVAKYLLKVCEGVACLHQRGFVHRDIKPQNILRRPGTDQPVLIDLGLVKDVTLAPAHEGISLSIVDGKAVGVGTLRYAAPEQFSGGDISPTADIHALGMLANECFSGNPPRSWSRIIRRSTSSIPSQRYSTVFHFSKAIRHRHALQLSIVVLIPVVLGMLVASMLFTWRGVNVSRKPETSLEHPQLEFDPIKMPLVLTGLVADANVSNRWQGESDTRSFESGTQDDGRLKTGVRFIPNKEHEDFE